MLALRVCTLLLLASLSCSRNDRPKGTRPEPTEEETARATAEIEELKRKAKDNGVPVSVRAAAVTRIVELSGREMAYLSSIDLSGANLSHATLTGATFASGNFKAANLTNTKLDITNLAGATFEGADMRGAILSYATVTNVDFTNADLRGASFNYARVDGAVFSGAKLAGATYNKHTKFDDGFSPAEFEMVDVGLIGR